MDKLKRKLQQIDGKGYKAYKDIQGQYEHENMYVCLDHIQGDPYASPSRVRVIYKGDVSFIDPAWLHQPHLKTAVEDYITRAVAKHIDRVHHQSTYKCPINRAILIDRPGQEVLPRTSCNVNDKEIEIRLSVELPARGRRIKGQEAIQLLCYALPDIIRNTFQPFDLAQCQQHVTLAQQQADIRTYLQREGYLSFIANGAILPRESGVSQRPLSEKEAIPFQSPPSQEINIPLSDGTEIKGMGIKAGITLIVGGGYHGKSTLLQAIERGVYSHIAGDGREWVITDDTAYKIRAEDGRRVEKVNITPFISDLPYGKDTDTFSTENASGSTSQATNIIEALEVKSRVLLIDEDTSATNFMIRDARMQQLVAKQKEPITPYVDKIRQLYQELGVSTILVLGGSGDYFEVADQVIMMDEYRPINVTQEAKEIAQTHQHMRQHEGGEQFGKQSARVPSKQGLNPQKGKREKVDGRGVHTILFGQEAIDLSLVEQIVHPSQTRAIANILRYLTKNMIQEKLTLNDMLDKLYERIDRDGLDFLSTHRGHPGDMAYPRKYEVAAALNRLRTLKVK
ncbi:ABC-ATPase domain-containing protein [Caldalkalibacillus salinus]|uniref:ABC-ATPase domain-containing protein n=1 Tax=Caldalkalibacillus salinus TaxID=2803787 RepID=UPI0019221885|nr:ABC-ATPase domain-containing protein [Caldalkalibacillus salinus]